MLGLEHIAYSVLFVKAGGQGLGKCIGRYLTPNAARGAAQYLCHL